VNVTQQFVELGRSEGIKEGLKQGVQKGQQTMLLKQLQTRFGTLSEATVARVNAAGTAELELWAERILTAPTLDDVLASS
jgi:flagellar biosynthesis/type III secretory pathway protein FliH